MPNLRVPELCRFYGIIIRMHYGDHAPPHFHATYGDQEALLGIDSLTILKGRLPPRARGLVVEWAALHQAELRDAWDRATRREELIRIEPLR